MSPSDHRRCPASGSSQAAGALRHDTHTVEGHAPVLKTTAPSFRTGEDSVETSANSRDDTNRTPSDHRHQANRQSSNRLPIPEVPRWPGDCC